MTECNIDLRDYKVPRCAEYKFTSKYVYVWDDRYWYDLAKLNPYCLQTVALKLSCGLTLGDQELNPSH